MTEEFTKPSEIELLKKRADLMGVKYHPSIGVEALKSKMEESSNYGKEDPELLKKKEHEDLIAEATKLIRVRVHCVNPEKAEWEGEIFTVANSVITTQRKYVPFGVDWHVPNIMFKMIKRRKYQQFTRTRDSKGNESRKGRDVPEFNVEVLPPLTEEELKSLAEAQLARNSIGDD